MKKMTIKEIENLLMHEMSTEQLAELENDERQGVQRIIKRFQNEQIMKQEQHQLFEKMSVFERDLTKKGFRSIAGVDEVGRGPLAGPVVACAVILPKDFYLPGLTDSKQLSKTKREWYYDKIIETAASVSVSMVDAPEIDQINIYQATIKAMMSAINCLNIKPDHLLIDAMTLPHTVKQTSLIKGDQRSISIAASSIVAKVTRDRYMEQLSREFPQYLFEQHMGYGTKEHVAAMKQYGITKEHRLSFRPVKEISEM